METRCPQSEVFSHNFECTKNVKDVIFVAKSINDALIFSYTVIYRDQYSECAAYIAILIQYIDSMRNFLSFTKFINFHS